MQSDSLWIVVIGALIFTGCAQTTSVKSLALPPVTTIEGVVNQLDESGFVLKDPSGEIYVHATLPNHESTGVTVGETVKVYGNLRSGRTGIFDGYVIKHASGKQTIVDQPSPHIGCVIQTGFQ